MHDVTVQPDRADTWAAMALARKSRLENKLNAVGMPLVAFVFSATGSDVVLSKSRYKRAFLTTFVKL